VASFKPLKIKKMEPLDKDSSNVGGGLYGYKGLPVMGYPIYSKPTWPYPVLGAFTAHGVVLKITPNTFTTSQGVFPHEGCLALYFKRGEEQIYIEPTLSEKVYQAGKITDEQFVVYRHFVFPIAEDPTFGGYVTGQKE
jgi:hypothetical protein